MVASKPVSDETSLAALKVNDHLFYLLTKQFRCKCIRLQLERDAIELSQSKQFNFPARPASPALRIRSVCRLFLGKSAGPNHQCQRTGSVGGSAKSDYLSLLYGTHKSPLPRPLIRRTWLVTVVGQKRSNRNRKRKKKRKMNRNSSSRKLTMALTSNQRRSIYFIGFISARAAAKPG